MRRQALEEELFEEEGGVEDVVRHRNRDERAVERPQARDAQLAKAGEAVGDGKRRPFEATGRIGYVAERRMLAGCGVPRPWAEGEGDAEAAGGAPAADDEAMDVGAVWGDAEMGEREAAGEEGEVPGDWGLGAAAAGEAGPSGVPPGEGGEGDLARAKTYSGTGGKRKSKAQRQHLSKKAKAGTGVVCEEATEADV